MTNGRQPDPRYVQPPGHLQPPPSVYEWKRILRRVKARRGRPNSKKADFYTGEATALDGTTLVVTSVVKHVGTVMSDFADYQDGRNIIRPIEEIANGCDLDRVTVMGAIDTLCAIGMLWRGFRGSSSGLENKCSEYQLVIADDLIERVPLHPPTERNDRFHSQVIPTHLVVESPPPGGAPDADQVTPTREPGHSDSPGLVTPTHPSNPGTNPVPTQHANTSPATADVEGDRPAEANKPDRIDAPATRTTPQIIRCKKCHRHEQQTMLDNEGHCRFCNGTSLESGPSQPALERSA